jgi:hypothetical protein
VNDHRAPAEAAREYAAAYAAHYSERDLATALQLYKKLTASHAGAGEAGYSRTQIQDIVKLVVPEQELLDTQMKLACICLESAISMDVEPTRTNPLQPGPSE